MKLTSRIRHRWLTCISRRYRTHTRHSLRDVAAEFGVDLEKD